MKKTIYIIAALLTAACTKPAEVLIPEADFASVKLSSLSAVVSEEGGDKTIFVATNREDWEVFCQEDWVDVSVDGNAVTFYVDENIYEESRLAVVEVLAGTKPDVAKARFKLLQSGASTEDLSVHGTANCYIATTCGSYKFDASVKGNGADDGNTFYSGYHGLEITDAAYADLAWESTFDADKTRSTKIISGAPVYSPEEKAVYFSTGEIQGNALITVHNAEGDILWSWHIWVSDEIVKTSKGNGLTWMDRNLGALNNDPGDISNRGMLYQWGRKDPFTIPGRGVTAPADAITAVSQNLSSIEETIASPTVVYDNSYWGDAQTLWDSFKTKYDPCPVGWRVPDRNVWEGISNENLQNTNTHRSIYFVSRKTIKIAIQILNIDFNMR